MWREARSFLWDHEKETFTCTQWCWRNVDVPPSGALATLLAVRHHYYSVCHALEHTLCWGSFAQVSGTEDPTLALSCSIHLFSPTPWMQSYTFRKWHTACVSAGLGHAPLWLTSFWMVLGVLPNARSDMEQAENIMKTWNHGGCMTALWVGKTQLNVSICFCVTEQQNH